MGQVNLYKIDEKKTDDFLNKLDEKFQFLGEQDYPFGNDEKNQCTVMTYANKVENRKLPEWKWILDEYEFEIPESSVAVKAILVIKSKNSMYAVTYPMRRKTPCFSYGDIRRVHRIYASN